MSLISLLHDDNRDHGGKPATVPWFRDARGYYPRLLRLDPEILGEEAGVYVLWHRGIRPRWLYVGASSNMAASISAARDAEVVLNYESSGGVYVTWAHIKPEFRDGVVNYLRATLTPLIDEKFESDDHRDPGAKQIAVVAPG